MSDPNDPTYGGAVPPPPPGGGYTPPPPPPGPADGYPPAPPAGGGYTPPPPPAGGGYTPPPPPAGGGYVPPQPPPPAGGYQTYQPGGFQPQGGTPAEPLMRVFARLIDLVIVFLVTFVIGLIFGVGSLGSGDGVGIGLAIVSGLLQAVVAIGYEVGLVSQRGQTVGKMLLGLKVVSATGTPLDLQAAVRRHLPSIALWVIAIIPLLNLLNILLFPALWIANTVMVFSSKESVYDKVGKTRVISTK